MIKAKHAIARCFNRASESYASYASIQKKIGNALLALIPQLHSPSWILDIGCGVGTHSVNLQSQYLQADVIASDIAFSMLSKINQKMAAPVCADFNRLPFTNGSMDLIFANMALHWSDSLRVALCHLHALLKPEGILVFTIPLMGSLKELHTAYHTAQLPVQINRFPQIASVAHDLSLAGFKFMTKEASYTLDFASFTDILHHLKFTGANYVRNRQQKSLLTKDYLRRLARHYPCLQLTYKILYAVATPAAAASHHLKSQETIYD